MVITHLLNLTLRLLILYFLLCTVQNFLQASTVAAEYHVCRLDLGSSLLSRFILQWMVYFKADGNSPKRHVQCRHALTLTQGCPTFLLKGPHAIYE